MKHHGNHGKGYENTDVRLGHSPDHSAAHTKAIKHLDSHDHTTKPGGEHPQSLPGDLTPHEKSHNMHSEMGKVKGIAGKGNY